MYLIVVYFITLVLNLIYYLYLKFKKNSIEYSNTILYYPCYYAKIGLGIVIIICILVIALALIDNISSINEQLICGLCFYPFVLIGSFGYIKSLNNYIKVLPEKIIIHKSFKTYVILCDDIIEVKRKYYYINGLVEKIKVISKNKVVFTYGSSYVNYDKLTAMLVDKVDRNMLDGFNH